MILPDFKLSTRQNKVWSETGLDSKKYCLDKNHFKSYPCDIQYCYNSRGFRDSDWPTNLTNAIWCFGDSFTVGLGSPIEHTWVNILQTKTNSRCINISMDGASNDWIARKIIRVLEVVQPLYIVVQWSFISRAEDTNTHIIDEQRRLQFSSVTQSDHISNFKKNIELVTAMAGNTKIIHSLIPNAHNIAPAKQFDEQWAVLRGSRWPQLPPQSVLEFNNLTIHEELRNYEFYNEYYDYLTLYELIKTNNLLSVVPLDKARDGYHYDIATAEQVVSDIMKLM